MLNHCNFTRAERNRVSATGAREGASVRIMYVQVARDEARRRFAEQSSEPRAIRCQGRRFRAVLRIFEPREGEDQVEVIQDLQTELARLR